MLDSPMGGEVLAILEQYEPGSLRVKYVQFLNVLVSIAIMVAPSTVKH